MTRCRLCFEKSWASKKEPSWAFLPCCRSNAVTVPCPDIHTYHQLCWGHISWIFQFCLLRHRDVTTIVIRTTAQEVIWNLFGIAKLHICLMPKDFSWEGILNCSTVKKLLLHNYTFRGIRISFVKHKWEKEHPSTSPTFHKSFSSPSFPFFLPGLTLNYQCSSFSLGPQWNEFCSGISLAWQQRQGIFFFTQNYFLTNVCKNHLQAFLLPLLWAKSLVKCATNKRSSWKRGTFCLPSSPPLLPPQRARPLISWSHKRGNGDNCQPSCKVADLASFYPLISGI